MPRVLRALALGLQLRDGSGIGRRLVGVEHLGLLPLFQSSQRLAEESLRCLGVAGRREVEIDRVPELVHRPVQIRPLAADLDVGLVDAPTPRLRPAPLPAQTFLHLRRETLHPTIDRGVVDRDAALGHHRFEVAVADRIPAVPAYGPEHDLPPEVTSLEVAHASTPRSRSRRHVTNQPDFATEPARTRPNLDGRDPRDRDARGGRERARGRRRLRASRADRARAGHGHARGSGQRRCDRLSQAADALRHRPRRRPEGARHRRGPRPARRRAEPAGPRGRLCGERMPRRFQLRQAPPAAPDALGHLALHPVSPGPHRVHPDRCRRVLVRRQASAVAGHPDALRARLGPGARPRQAEERRRHAQTRASSGRGRAAR